MQPQILETLVLIIHVLASLSIIGLVLIQHGKGADMGSGFGGGSSGTVFGSSGAGNFLTKATTIVAVTFFISSFTLAYFAKENSVAVKTLGVPDMVEQVHIDAVDIRGKASTSELPVLTSEEVPEP